MRTMRTCMWNGQAAKLHHHSTSVRTLFPLSRTLMAGFPPSLAKCNSMQCLSDPTSQPLTLAPTLHHASYDRCHGTVDWSLTHVATGRAHHHLACTLSVHVTGDHAIRMRCMCLVPIMCLMGLGFLGILCLGLMSCTSRLIHICLWRSRAALSSSSLIHAAAPHPTPSHSPTHSSTTVSHTH